MKRDSAVCAKPPLRICETRYNGGSKQPVCKDTTLSRVLPKEKSRRNWPHQIGVELAEQLLQGRFQTVVTTHLNTKHYHNHIVWCSVALDNGRKYHSNAKSYYTEVRARSDALCRKYGLSIIETKESEQSSMPYHVWLDEQENRPNWTSMVRQDVDEAISQALTWRQFLQCLSQKGYTFRFNRKYPTLKPPGKPRPIRFKTLGKQYTPEAIQQRILYSQKTYPAEPHVRHVRLHGTYQKVRKLKGLRVFYYRELYMLGVFHRKPWHPSPAVREKIRQLDKRIEQYEFLMNRDTRTLAQLRDLRAQTEAEVRKLNAEAIACTKPIRKATKSRCSPNVCGNCARPSNCANESKNILWK